MRGVRERLSPVSWSRGVYSSDDSPYCGADVAPPESVPLDGHRCLVYPSERRYGGVAVSDAVVKSRSLKSNAVSGSVRAVSGVVALKVVADEDGDSVFGKGDAGSVGHSLP